MGYYKSENFDDSFEWYLNTINGGFATVTDNNFEHLQEYEDKVSSLQITFSSLYKYEYLLLSKNYYTPIYFKFKDVYGKEVLYDTLRLVYNYSGDLKSVDYNKPDSFIYTLGIKSKGVLLREWFLPVVNNCKYNCIDLDLEPLYSQSDSYDEIFISVLKHPGNSRIVFGSVYLVQDKDEIHNIKLALSDLLHLKYSNFLTRLSTDANYGDKFINVVGTSDIHKGTTIQFGQGELKEVHTIKNVDLNSSDTARLELMDEFDSNKIQYAWPSGTLIYRSIPASIVEMRDAESIFPLYFIYSEIFTNAEDSMHVGNIVDSYVRDPDGNHKVSIRKAWDSVSVNVTINIFSDTPETAMDMWRYLKSVITTRDLLYVAGVEHQYVIAGERDVSPEDSEILPNYVMDLTFYFRNNVYNRKYINYPRFKNMAITYEIKPVEAIQ